MKEVIYLCDGYNKCANSAFCGLHTEDGECYHTASPRYAKYGRCKHPEEHPERFLDCGEYYKELMTDDLH